jgi:hypothetical protein
VVFYALAVYLICIKGTNAVHGVYGRVFDRCMRVSLVLKQGNIFLEEDLQVFYTKVPGAGTRKIHDSLVARTGIINP